MQHQENGIFTRHNFPFNFFHLRNWRMTTNDFILYLTTNSYNSQSVLMAMTAIQCKLLLTGNLFRWICCKFCCMNQSGKYTQHADYFK